ncbi:MAG: hypothetical protein U1G07_15750 [Verrucomicrobiota bacterium]
MAVEGIGRFGSLPREFGTELLTLLEDPQFQDQTGLIANRLVPAVLGMDSPVPILLSLLERRPDLSDALKYLLIPAIANDKVQLAANREAVAALLDHSSPDLQAAAQAVLAELPEPPPLPTREVSQRLSTSLASADEAERRRALHEMARMAAATPELRQALSQVMQQDPSVLLRIEAGVELTRLAPGDPALGRSATRDGDALAREIAARFERGEMPVLELMTAIADRSAPLSQLIQPLAQVDDAYWMSHAEEKGLVSQALAVLHRDPDVRVYEAAVDAYSHLIHESRRFYSLAELEPYFLAMETSLSPGEYAIAMRDLKLSLDSYWQSHGFRQNEPTHLPVDLVQVLLVGPSFQNRAAYRQMVQAMQQVDPAFQPRQ